MDKELEYLGKATTNPERPCIAILGGAKVSDKIEVIQNLMKLVDKLLIGGAMAYTFARAKGEPTGNSLVEEDKVDLARELMASAGDKLLLPLDHVVTAELTAGAASEIVESIPVGKLAADIGPKTIARLYESHLGSQNHNLERPHGCFRETPIRQGHSGACQSRG